MKLYPMPGTVLLEYVEPVEQRSSIILPSTFKRDEQRTGRVMAVADYKPGRGAERLPVSVQVGQYALFRKHSADVFSIAGRQFFSVKEDDLQLVTDDRKTFESITTSDQ